MKITNVTTLARKHIFESARFYYWLLVVLTFFFLFIMFIHKLSFVYTDNHWTGHNVVWQVLNVFSYFTILISAYYLRKKIPSYVFWCWGGIVFIFLINEFRFAWGNTNYSLIKSLTKSQGYYTAKFTMPLLFWGVWCALKNTNHFVGVFIYKLQLFLTINAVFIIVGALFDVSLFKSYPLSGRWGYSGLLWLLNFNCASYGILVIYLLEKEIKQWATIFLFVVALLLLGQKAGLLYLMLIFVFLVIKNHYIRFSLLGSSFVAFISAPFWLPYIVSFIPFWENVYNKHGVWGVLFSLRNENIETLWMSIKPHISFFDSLLGVARYPVTVEMMPFDVFLLHGFVGLFLIGMFFWKLIPRLAWAIPLIVSFFAGGLYETTLIMIIYFVVIKSLDTEQKRL